MKIILDLKASQQLAVPALSHYLLLVGCTENSAEDKENAGIRTVFVSCRSLGIMRLR